MFPKVLMWDVFLILHILSFLVLSRSTTYEATRAARQLMRQLDYKIFDIITKTL